MQSIQQLMEMVLQESQAIVLSMIVNVEGSSYRKEGTWMLLLEDGRRVGVISGGCLENDLHKRATELFRAGKSKILHYDLSDEDDLGWGRGVGCNGVVTVFIRDINADFRNFLRFMHQRLQAKEPMYFIQSMTDFNLYECMGRTGDHFSKGQMVMPLDLEPLLPFEKKLDKSSEEKNFFISNLSGHSLPFI